MISVIIPAYNCATYIEETIQSVERQTYPQHLIQLIIVNDGSTDNTREILQRYDHKYQIIHTPNQGVSSARNEGLKYTKGNYIQYLDSDDLLMPNKLEKQVEALMENDADVAYGNWRKFKHTENKHITMANIERAINGDPSVALFTDFWCPPAALLYSKRIVEKIGGWKTWLPIIQDARYFLDAALCEGHFVHTPFICAQYRVHEEGSVSTSSKLNFIIDVLKNAQDVKEIWGPLLSKHPDKKAALIQVLRGCINELSVLDPLLMHEAIDTLLAIAPQYVPEKAGILKTMSKLFGYRRAEQVATLKRRLLS